VITVTALKHIVCVLLPVVSEEQVYVIGQKGENTTLQCLDHPVNMSSVLFHWKKDGAVVATQDPSNPSEHLSILNNGSLRISGLLYIDEGLYTCECQTSNPSSSWQTHSNVQLKIAGMDI